MTGNRSDMGYAKINFFCHPDHLGSTSMVTDAEGYITQNVSYIPYGEVFVEERNGVWNTPYLFNAKELDEETGMYYYGARYLNPKDTRWISVDPLFEKYVGMSPYGYCAGNPVGLVDPDGKATYLVVETKGTGHTFILVVTGKKVIVYTYGRYAEGGVMGGQGVLLKLENEAAEKYMKTELYRMEANAYIVSDANDSQICHFFDSQFNSSTELPQSGKHDIDTYGKIVDKYYLFGNNCTTKSCNAIKSSGSQIFNDQGILGYDEDFVIPSSLKDFLQENAINCTNDLKKHLRILQLKVH